MKKAVECNYLDRPVFENCSYIKESWKELLKTKGVFERFFEANFLEIEERKVPETVKEQYKQVKKFVSNLSERIKKGEGLLFKGTVGTMKTTLAVAVLQEALWQGFSGRKILMQSLLDEIFMMKAKGADKWLDFERQLRDCSLLVVDELGKHQSEGWVLNKFDAIVSERHERRKSTIFVTNLTTNELKGFYSEGVIDRFRHVNEVITFKGDSLRERGD